MKLIIILVIAVSCEAFEVPLPQDFNVRLLSKMAEMFAEIMKWANDPTKQDEHRMQCLSAINAFLKHYNSSWALNMIDASTKLQSGLLLGNLVDLGQYDQCVKTSAGPTEDDPYIPKFTGQHCLVSNTIYIPNGTIMLDGEKMTLMELFGNPFIPLTVAQCYPSLCKPIVIEEGLNAVFSNADNVFDLLGVDAMINVTVHPRDCHVAEGPPYDTVDWVVLGVIVVLFGFVCLSTAIDYIYIKINEKPPKSRNMKLLVSFSIYTNANKLFSMKLAEDAVPSLNGLKFLSMCWVIIGHKYMYLVREPIINFTDAFDYLKQLPRMIVINGPMAVETFFLISGMLNMYGFLTITAKLKRYTLKDVWNGYVLRYIRLTPAYLMMVGFTATWLYRLRDGPLWDRFVGTYKKDCRENYWGNILYINNYVGSSNYCLMQSWYLSADMQFFWLSPLVMYPLLKWPKYGRIQLLVLIILSFISPFLVSWYDHIASPIPITTNYDRSVRETTELFYPMHTKSMSYVLGIAGGNILYLYRQGKISLEINFWIRVLGWLACAGMMLYAVFGGYYLYQFDYKYNQLFSAFFIGFQRFFWSAGLLWLILMCVKGHGGLINNFLSWNGFIPLARLSYCVYLTHIVILMCSIAAQRNSFYIADYDQLVIYFGDLILCLFTGFVLSMLVEVPIMNIMKIFRTVEDKRPRTKLGSKQIPPLDIYIVNNDR